MKLPHKHRVPAEADDQIKMLLLILDFLLLQFASTAVMSAPAPSPVADVSPALALTLGNP